MNIFVTDPDPVTSAHVLPDKHIVKMPLETCQMLAIVCSDKWGHGYGQIHKSNGEPYKTDKGAFRNHPCTVWARESLGNWEWLIAHGNALGEEYTKRYGKVHKSHLVIKECAKYLVPLIGERTPFALAMDNKWKINNDPIKSYRNFYSNKVFQDGSIPTWKHTPTPQWFDTLRRTQ